MSYCGTCGGFYHPDCPQRFERDGPNCAPAPNPHEAAAIDWAKVADHLETTAARSSPPLEFRVLRSIALAIKAGL